VREPISVLEGRTSGVLLHITSLPSGRIDVDAYEFVDWLVEAGQSYWQLLPVHPPDGVGSPYASRSAFAGDYRLLPDRPAHVAPAAAPGAWIEEWVACAGEVERERQQRFQREWLALRRYANARGIRLIGDVPLYVDGASCDVLSHPELFDRKLVAGAAPSPNTPAGQRWGVPAYDWPAHASTGFAWWLDRLGRELELFDLLRLDHFRGLQAFWALDPDELDPARGAFHPGPGPRLFDAVRRRFGRLPFIVEDLGLITPDVEELRDSLGLPGMTVVSRGPASCTPPSAWRPDSVLYSSTHDSDTLAGWWESHGRRMFGPEFLARCAPGQRELDCVLERIYQTENPLVIIPVQDLLELGPEARMNRPGTVSPSNWRWKLERPLDPAQAAALRERTRRAGRLPGQAAFAA
jgi:4-alpha-glucanotransferase